MSKNNPFNLRDMIPISAKRSSEPFVFNPSSTYTPEQKEKMLENYEEVSEGGWNQINSGTHVRYQKTGGAFMRGGFVGSTYISNKEKTRGNKMMKLTTAPGGGKDWTINLSGNEKMWKNVKFQSKETPAVVIDGGIKQTTDNLQNKLEQIEIELTRISNEQKRIIALIKKLHNINI
jgi:hypothetical protein